MSKKYFTANYSAFRIKKPGKSIYFKYITVKCTCKIPHKIFWIWNVNQTACGNYGYSNLFYDQTQVFFTIHYFNAQ